MVLLIRPSVCPSIPYGLITRKPKVTEKPKLVQTFHREGITDVPIFSSKSQRMEVQCRQWADRHTHDVLRNTTLHSYIPKDCDKIVNLGMLLFMMMPCYAGWPAAQRPQQGDECPDNDPKRQGPLHFLYAGWFPWLSFRLINWPLQCDIMSTYLMYQLGTCCLLTKCRKNTN